MALALAVQNVIGARRRMIRHFTLTASGNYTTGGDTVNFTTATNPNNEPAALAFSRLPDSVVVQNVPDGYTAQVVAGTTIANYLLKFFTAEGAELAAGAYPAAITGGAIQIEAINKPNI